MIRVRLFGVCATGLVWLSAGVGCVNAVDDDAKPEKSESGSEVGSENKTQTVGTKSIPLSSIVTTSPQKGMLHTRRHFPQKDGDRDSKVANGYLQQILRASKGGASNAFLVDAVNASSAIAASSSVFLGGRSAHTAVPVNKPDPPRGNHWLVVYLGSGPSTPIWWKVEDAKVVGNSVTLTYYSALPSPATEDVRLYYYWVPLGMLAPGIYEVNLFDASQKAITLMRRVTVLPPIKN